MEPNNIKIVVVGDNGVQKTQLLWCYAKGPSADGNYPSVFDNYVNLSLCNLGIQLDKAN